MQKHYRMLALVFATAPILVASAGSLTSSTSLSQINDFYPEGHSANEAVTNRFFRLPWTRGATDSHATAPSDKVPAGPVAAIAGHALNEMAEPVSSTRQNVDKRSNNIKTSVDQSSIHRVVSDISLSLGKSLCDAWVTTKVKLALMFSANLNSAHIFIKTRNGIVTLAGNVPTETEHGMATEVADQVLGVKSVNARNLVFPNEFQQFTIQDPANGLFLF